jgi:YhcH/YjgK/YiaL family protein
MISDTLDNIRRYFAVLPGLESVAGFLSRTDLSSLPLGRHELAGDPVYLSLTEYQTRPASEKRWEGHKQYVDLQIVVSGEEYIGVLPVASLTPNTEYSAGKDVLFFDPPAGSSAIMMTPGYFCLLFPEDGHQPGFHPDSARNVRKAVFKIRI